MTGKPEAILNEWFQVLPAQITPDGNAKLQGNSKKFKTFVVEPIDQQKWDTVQSILQILHPDAKELGYHKWHKQLIYDLEFFASIETGQKFVDIRDIIVKNDNNIDKKNAIEFLKKFFSATSQIALKMEMERQDTMNKEKIITPFETRFDQRRSDDFRDKFMKKIKELHIDKQYHTLCKQFEPLYDCTENIIFHSLKHLEDINFWIAWLSLWRVAPDQVHVSPEDLNDPSLWWTDIKIDNSNTN